MIPKLRLTKSVKRLRQATLNAYVSTIPSNISDELPWEFLRALIQDCDLVPDTIRAEVLDAVSERSPRKYLALQRYMEPQMYDSSSVFADVAAVLSFLKKFPFGSVDGLDPVGSAVSKFDLAEKLCRITNRRLRWFRSRGYRHKQKWLDLHSVFHTARLKIASILGDFKLEEALDLCRHGPGGALGVTGDATTLYYKYGAEAYTVTTRALPYATIAILRDELWSRYVTEPKDFDVFTQRGLAPLEVRRLAVQQKLRVVNYNKVTFVPKTAQTHRAIAIEPLMNIYLQLGVGDLISSRLKRVGINLRSQRENQILAREGSLRENLGSINCPATLDMSMASDTLCTELVRELLPEDWFNYLSDLRSPSGMFADKIIHWAKFSSMGNGFTFPLETLIFYSLAYSVAKHHGYSTENIRVYGDDVIVPSGMALRLVEVLAYAGFKTNTEKSFIFGPFRESCGTDWYEGRDVRPLFLKRKIQNAETLLYLANSVGGLSDPTLDRCIDRRFFFRTAVVARLPSLVRQNLRGPKVRDLLGHLHCPWDLGQKSPFVLWDPDLQSWRFFSAKAIPVVFDRQLDSGAVYLQYMTSRSLGREFGDSSPHLLALEEWNSLLGSTVGTGSRADVVRRNRTRSVLATQTSNGWRND